MTFDLIHDSPGCDYNPWSSRACQRGTKCCDIDHLPEVDTVMTKAMYLAVIKGLGEGLSSYQNDIQKLKGEIKHGKMMADHQNETIVQLLSEIDLLTAEKTEWKWAAAKWSRMYKELGSAPAVTIPPCDNCQQPQAVLGALEFGPPDADGKVMKRHVCVKCFAATTLAAQDGES